MMELLDPILRIYEADDPTGACRALAEALSDHLPVRAIGWRGTEPDWQGSWPEGDAVAEQLLAAAPKALDHLAGRVLSFPLSIPGGRLWLLGEPGPLDPDREPVERLVQAFGRVLEHHRRLRLAEEERDRLRRRAEESEALHVLGLAANRSLDPDEVLDLVARFTRTLLGAHYATVSTSEGPHLHTAAVVGVRTRLGPDGDPLAARVVAEGKPLIVSADAGSDEMDPLAFHRAEGMRTGLGLPLSLFGETFGALVVGYRRPYPLQPRDTRLALALAGHAAVAISNARLHRTLADRSRELERAYEELRWSTQAKERFFASMSHELRTPLNAILGYQSLLLEGLAGEMSAPQLKFVENANRATRNLLRLVNDVLDLSKLEAGKVELVVGPVDLLEVVREALATMQPLADAKSVRLVRPSRTDPIRLTTDRERVHQVMLNLLSNAVKFTEEGEVSIGIRLEPEEHPRWVEVSVTDTGSGIDAHDQERIFHEFEQVVGSAARGGTGLGLPISRKLARLLGGDLRVESVVGQGSTFVFRLPLHPAEVNGTTVAERMASQ